MWNMNIQSQLIMARRVPWIGPLRKEKEGDCVVLHFNNRSIVTFILDMMRTDLDMNLNNIKVLPLGFFYRPPHLITPQIHQYSFVRGRHPRAALGGSTNGYNLICENRFAPLSDLEACD